MRPFPSARRSQPRRRRTRVDSRRSRFGRDAASATRRRDLASRASERGSPLRFLDLSGNDLRRAGAEALAEALLVSSSGSSYPVGVAAAFAASAPVSATAPCAEVLDLSANRVGERTRARWRRCRGEGVETETTRPVPERHRREGRGGSGGRFAVAGASVGGARVAIVVRVRLLLLQGAHARGTESETQRVRRRRGAAAVANALRESAAESAKVAKESRGIAPASLLDDASTSPRVASAQAGIQRGDGDGAPRWRTL